MLRDPGAALFYLWDSGQNTNQGESFKQLAIGAPSRGFPYSNDPDTFIFTFPRFSESKKGVHSAFQMAWKRKNRCSHHIGFGRRCPNQSRTKDFGLSHRETVVSLKRMAELCCFWIFTCLSSFNRFCDTSPLSEQTSIKHSIFAELPGSFHNFHLHFDTIQCHFLSRVSTCQLSVGPFPVGDFWKMSYNIP